MFRSVYPVLLLVIPHSYSDPCDKSPVNDFNYIRVLNYQMRDTVNDLT